MKQKWDERYKDATYAYGTAPNQFFKTWLPRFEPGALLMPADGEGRNGVFAAELGWDVTSFDLSGEGRAKALQLAAEKEVTLHYLVGDLQVLHFEPASFDAIGLIYAHFDGDTKAACHQQLIRWLKPGGIVILEAFSKSHLDYTKKDPRVGGPKEIDMLYSTEEILCDFSSFDILQLREEEVQLEEGKYHVGKGSVIRFVGHKLL